MIQPGSDTNVLQVTNLTKEFSWRNSLLSGKKEHLVAVDKVSFALKRGEILGLLGPNGAGKTTIIHMLLSTLTPTNGDIFYFGQDFRRHRESILREVTFASGYIRLPWRLTVWENLQVYGMLYGLARQERGRRIERFLEYFGVWDQRHKTMSQLSSGQVTRVMIAKAFLSYPQIALLDEPTASLDPDIAQVVRQFIRKQREEYGVSILFTSHNMQEATQLCDRVIFLNEGKIWATDTPEALAQSIFLPQVTLEQIENVQEAKRFCDTHGLRCEPSAHRVTIAVEEERISWLLSSLAEQGVHYSRLQIVKPTLEDYFLNTVNQPKASQ